MSLEDDMNGSYWRELENLKAPLGVSDSLRTLQGLASNRASEASAMQQAIGGITAAERLRIQMEQMSLTAATEVSKWNNYGLLSQLEEMAKVATLEALKWGSFSDVQRHAERLFYGETLKGLMDRPRNTVADWLADHHNSTLADLSGAMSSIQEALRATAGISEFERLNDYATALHSMHGLEGLVRTSAQYEALLGLQVISGAAAFEIANEWRRNGIANDFIDLSEKYKHLIESDELDLTEVEEFAKDVNERFWETKKHRAELLNLILVLVMYFSQEVGQQRHVDETNRNFNDVKVTISTLMQTMERIENSMVQRSYIVLNRPALVRAEPEAGSEILGVLLPNQSAFLLGGKGKWINVEYLDLSTNETLQGWVLKKYLLRLPDVEIDHSEDEGSI